ncbi:hypothetical protein [Mycolicibacterium gilvum]|uniref:hypothetical protein n=1 Tax=Mycolicibacterium gilvum TaxID=1804 RepID=UPI0040460B7F
MTQPLTGTTWNGAGLNDLGSEFLEIGQPMQVLTRMARGLATDISPHNEDGSVRYSPFAQDNKLRGDLLGILRGHVTNPEPNQGWLTTGAYKDGSGPSSKPNVRSSAFRIIQNNLPYYTSITEESEAFSFTPVDTMRPVVQYLRKNLPTHNANGDIIVPDPGALNAGTSRTVKGNNPGRQFLVCREIQTSKTGLPVYKVDGYCLARSSDFGNSKKEKDDGEQVELTYEPESDNIMMAIAPNELGEFEYQPVLMHTWYGGPGWTALGGVPQLPGAAPVATATTALKATLAFDAPVGAGDPWEYTAQQSTDGGTTWSAALTVDGGGIEDIDVSSGTVTLHLASLTAGATTKLRATVIGTNGSTATTQASNTITVAAE